MLKCLTQVKKPLLSCLFGFRYTRIFTSCGYLTILPIRRYTYIAGWRFSGPREPRSFRLRCLHGLGQVDLCAAEVLCYLFPLGKADRPLPDQAGGKAVSSLPEWQRSTVHIKATYMWELISATSWALRCSRPWSISSHITRSTHSIEG